MATGNGHGGLAGMRDALDACIHRLRRGSSLELALAECGPMADALRPLAALAQQLATAARPAPAPSAERMRAGRDRFLSAAGALRDGAAPHQPFDLAAAPGGGGGGQPPVPLAPPAGADDDWLTDALDTAIAAVRGGATIDAALSGVAVDAPSRAALARHLTTLVELLTLVHDLESERTARPAAPSASLAAGRDRLLAAAAALDADAAAALDAALAAPPAVGRAEVAHAGAEGGFAPEALAAFARSLAAAAAPVAPPDLAAGRARFLAAAAATEQAAAEALDAGLAAAAVGAPVAGALAAAGADGQLDELSALVALAGTLAPAAAPAPAPALAAGRERFLAIAAQAQRQRAAVEGAQRAAVATARPSVGARVGRWLRGGATPRPLALRLGVLGTMAAAALLSIGTAGRVPAVAAALPGDTLYTVKEWSRDAQLLLTTFDMDAARREARRARIQTERLVDTLRAHADGRSEETSFSARYDAFKTESQGDEKPFGTLWVTRLDDDAPGSIGLAWRTGDTRFDLPDGLDSMADVPRGVEVKLRVRTGEAERPLALRVSVKDVGPLLPLTATATTTATLAATPGITVTLTPEVEATAALTATPSVSPTLAAPTATVVVTVTTPASATPEATETATTSGEGENGVRHPYFEGRVQQVYETAAGSGQWRCRIIHRLDGLAYEIDVSALSAAERGRVQTDGIVKLRLKGPLDTMARTGVALSFEGFEPVSCRNSRAIGLVREYRPGDRLVIELAGGTTEEFQLGPDRDGAKPTIVGEVRVGGQVHVDYRVCGGRTANLATVITGEQGTATAGAETGERVSLIGSVTGDPMENGRVVRFDLWAKRNSEAYQSWAVEVDAGRVKGVARLAKGQRVEVRGRLVNREILVIVADEVRFLGQARPTETASPTVAPPAPTATPEPTTPEPTVGAGAAPTEPPAPTAEPSAWPTIQATPAAVGTAEARLPAAGRGDRSERTPAGAARARS